MLFPIVDVKKWFLENRRSFPWRENPNPYQVWVSEMMLQQTIASVVVSYYERWMQRFPSIETLADAHFEDVIKMWEGLGYYARARHLHNGAKYIMAHCDGKLPEDEMTLSCIPGIGPYTKGAILSFAYHQRKPAIDGNVTRVLARYLKIFEEIEKTSVKKRIFSYVEEILPLEESWIISEALIEIGAIICKKKPLCKECPLMLHCKSYRDGLQEEIPKKKKRPSTTFLFRLVFVIEHEGSILLNKGKEGNVMGHLYEFPYIESKAPPSSTDEALAAFRKQYPFAFTYIKSLEEEKHTFTRYRASLFPFILQAHNKSEGIWIRKEDLANLPFSSGHRRLLAQVIK